MDGDSQQGSVLRTTWPKNWAPTFYRSVQEATSNFLALYHAPQCCMCYIILWDAYVMNNTAFKCTSVPNYITLCYYMLWHFRFCFAMLYYIFVVIKSGSQKTAANSLKAKSDITPLLLLLLFVIGIRSGPVPNFLSWLCVLIVLIVMLQQLSLKSLT